MKNILKTAALVSLMLLYGFEMSLYNGSDFLQYSLFTKQSAQSPESYHSAISKTSFCHTTATENTVNVVTSVPGPSFKNQHTSFAELIRLADKISQTKFLQNNYYSKYLLLHFNNYAIIFPFHHFW